MVALHPEHLLPNGNDLSVFSPIPDSDWISAKHYVAGYDQTLRESPGTTSDCRRLPSFTFECPHSNGLRPNVFLIVLNAEIKFRRYERMVPQPEKPLPPDVQKLIAQTLKLANLIYWEPEDIDMEDG